jgi:hypothetical protein
MAGWAVAIPLDSLKNRHQVCRGKIFIFTSHRLLRIRTILLGAPALAIMASASNVPVHILEG